MASVTPLDAIIQTAGQVISGVANIWSTSINANAQKDINSEQQETIRNQQDNALLGGLFATSSSNTSAGWSELLNINDVPQSTVLSVVAVLFAFVILKTNK